VPAAEGVIDGVDLALLDRDVEDDRRILIEAEHPELGLALRRGTKEVHVGGTTVNPVLHIAMHEIVANQLWNDEPPEAWATVQRLLADGYERHEILHMLASVVSAEVFGVSNQRPANMERLRTALAALPSSWEQQRTEIPSQRHMNRAERRQAAARRRHR
jgi:hypothetical protein